MNWLPTQQALAAKGYNPGPLDGIGGVKSWGALLNYMAGRDLGDKGRQLAGAMAAQCPKVGIDTPLRIAHFLAQCCVETGAFRFMREIWGPTDAQRGYEGRDDLGNDQLGDGFRFLGRGIFQLTGRDNYTRFGKRLGLDLVGNPSLAEQPDIAVRVACLYWADHNLNAYADQDDIRATSNGINRGNPASTREPNGFAERKAFLTKARQVLR